VIEHATISSFHESYTALNSENQNKARHFRDFCHAEAGLTPWSIYPTLRCMEGNR